MGLKINSIQNWDDLFFRKFTTFKNSIYENKKKYLPETTMDLEKLLAPNSPFANHNRWKAWLVYDGDIVVGRVFASRRFDEKFNESFIPFGYFEALNENASRVLIEQVKKWAKSFGDFNIKGPIQGNAFNGSRFLLSSKKRFYSEPFHCPEYIQYFEKNGLKICMNWVSVRYSRYSMLMVNIFFLIKFFRKKRNLKTLNVRKANFSNWEKDLKVMYSMMMSSYEKMAHVEKLTFEEFKIFNGDLKHIICEKDCLIMEDENGPLAFLILVKDQLNWLYRQHKYKNTFLNSFISMILYLRIKFGVGKSLLLYLGKVPDEGKYKKLSHILYSKMLRNQGLGLILNPPIFGYMASNSPTLKMIPPGHFTISEYCLFSDE